jgi:hypothetical protein
VKKSALCLGLAILLALASVRLATAATFTVTSLADSGPGSLRQAVLDANAAAGADTVVFAPGLNGTITLTSGEILITGPLAVNGPGAAVLTVSGNDNSRIFHVENLASATPIDVTLSGLTLTQGFSALAGGAVFADSENLTILDSVVSNSTSGVQQDASPPGCGGNVGFFGTTGGTLRIANSTLTGGVSMGITSAMGGNLCVFQGGFLLERSTLSGGTAHLGGGIVLFSLTADSTISLSTISGNLGRESAGGIYSESLGAALTIDSSTISGNNGGSPSPSFAGFGGGIEVDQGTLRIINSTISGNRGNGGGGGIFFPGGAESSLLLRLTTVSNNTAGFEGGGILVANPAVQVELDHSIVANGTPQDVATLTLGGPLATFTVNYSLIETVGDVLVVGANNLLGVDPLLGPLANNGGPTLTHLPLPGSPVINAGNPAIPSPPPTDQRGFARIVGAAVDLGSVEVQAATVEVPTLSQVGIFALSVLLFAAGLLRLRQDRRKDGGIVAFPQRRGGLR